MKPSMLFSLVTFFVSAAQADDYRMNIMTAIFALGLIFPHSAMAIPGGCQRGQEIVSRSLKGDLQIAAKKYLQEVENLRQIRNKSRTEGCYDTEKRYKVLKKDETLPLIDGSSYEVLDRDFVAISSQSLNYRCVIGEYFNLEGQVQDQRLRLKEIEKDIYSKMERLNIDYRWSDSIERISEKIKSGELNPTSWNEDFQIIDHGKSPCEPSN